MIPHNFSQFTSSGKLKIRCKKCRSWCEMQKYNYKCPHCGYEGKDGEELY